MSELIDTYTKFDAWKILGPAGFFAERDFRRPTAFFGRGQFPTLTPLSYDMVTLLCSRGIERAVDDLQLPTTKGFEHRTFPHCFGATGSYVTPEEQRIRETKVMERMRPWLEDYEGVWGKYQKECEEAIKPIMEIDLKKLSDVDLRDFTEFDYYKAGQKLWYIHFLCMYPGAYGDLLLEDFLKEKINIDDRDPLYHDMMMGSTNRLFEMEEKLWNLGQRAIELGLEKTFLETPAEALLSKRQDSAQMKSWFDEFDAFLQTDGYRVEVIHEISSPPWMYEPTPALSKIVTLMKSPEGFRPAKVRAEQLKKREKAVAEVSSRLPGESREEFSRYLGLCQSACSYQEGHTFWTEYFYQTISYKVFTEIARRYVEAGSLDKWQDMYYCLYQEVLLSMVMKNHHDLRGYVRWRKEEREKYFELEKRGEFPPVFAVGELSMEMARDPIFMKIIGVSAPPPKPVEGADFVGVAGSSGIAEGPARVVRHEEDLVDVKPGEILFAVYTDAPFTYVFSRIAGVVTDTGGTLGHAAIVGRENGIPAIVQTRIGTTTVKTGQRVRIDGNTGAVYILDK